MELIGCPETLEPTPKPLGYPQTIIRWTVSIASEHMHWFVVGVGICVEPNAQIIAHNGHDGTTSGGEGCRGSSPYPHAPMCRRVAPIPGGVLGHLNMGGSSIVFHSGYGALLGDRSGV